MILARWSIAIGLASGIPLWGQALPFEPLHDAGTTVTGAYEGWFRNSDGSFSLLLGYYNRNRQQELDIPVGPENRIEPGGPDRGQPAHFMPGRGWGLFTVTVPSDFGQGKITWTIVANGKTTVIPAGLHPDYEISPFQEVAVGNTPPEIRFEENGPSARGPGGLRIERQAKMETPLALTVWVSDDAKWTTNSGARPQTLGTPVTLRWAKYRGAGRVTFDPVRPAVEKTESSHSHSAAEFTGKAVTAVSFSEPGDYVLHVVANDYSGDGGGGFQCCWTHGLVNVSVKAGP